MGYDTDYGARPLKRAIQRELQNPLAVKMLGDEFPEGETICVERGKEGLEFTALASDQLLAVSWLQMVVYSQVPPRGHRTLTCPICERVEWQVNC